MQLFITEYTKKDTTVTINDAELLSQLRKVLRARIGDIIRVQSPINETKKVRYEVRIEVRDNTTLEGTIVSEQIHESAPEKRSMIIAMPNKRDKVELITQKLCECGLDQILFRPSERSVIKERNSKKEERLQKIVKEAVEQSWGRKLPNLGFTTDITKYLQDSELIVFDKSVTSNELLVTSTVHHVTRHSSLVTGVIGPEGGLTPRDYEKLEAYKPEIVSLGETVLRMETAAIVGGRLLKSNEQLITNN